MHKAAKHVRTDESVTAQASTQSWRESACRRVSIESSLCSQNQRTNRNLTRQKNIQPQAAGDARRMGLCIFLFSSRYNTFLSPSYIFVCCMHAAPGLFSWSMELLVFASRQLTPNSARVCWVRYVRYGPRYLT